MSTAEQKRQYRELRKLEGHTVGQTTKREPHRGKAPKKKEESKWERRKVVAWDGEGANVRNEDGSNTHVYNLLSNSDGVHILNHDGLGTKEVFDFFLTYGDPKAINVVYGGSYDCNMLLVDIPKERIELLWKTGSCYWGEYKILYTNRKKFTVQKLIYVNGKKTIVSFVLWDVIGYYQCSFVQACRKWLGELSILDEIESMKLERAVFSVDRIEEIVDYNRKECLLLVQLMGALFDALDMADIQLLRYDGAGSIAAALLKKNAIHIHKGKVPKEVNLAAQYAYSGGRIEAPKIGTYNGSIYRYDINSAYPSIMLTLPSYEGATWTQDEEWDGSDNSIVHVRWTHQKELPFYPLWFREYDGTILYPRWGEGWYWGAEVRNLVKYHPGTYKILGATNCHLAHQYHPFHFIAKEYATRLMFKDAGSMASEALKLGINSLYGKTAQQTGWRKDGRGTLRLPTYHQLLWAGQITAGCRAVLYDAAMQCPNDVVAFATDALITTTPIEVPIGKALGQWTHDSFDGITIVQPGVYWLKSGDEWQDKYRGFDKGSLSREHIVGSWLLGQNFEARLTRFVGMGSALMASDFEEKWRTWQTDSRTLGLRPNGKRKEGADVDYWAQLCDTIPAVNMNIGMISTPYSLVWDEDAVKLTPTLDGVDVNLIEQEYQDSYA